MAQVQAVSQPTQQTMAGIADLTIVDPVAAEQVPQTPSFQFAGMQQEGTRDRLKGKKILIYGGGDVWPKFNMAPLLHLGIRPEDITIVDLKSPPEGLEWQYAGVNVITRKELNKRLRADKDYIKKQNYDFALVATSPSAHKACAQEAIRNGLPVMIEKPIFPSIEQYKQFVRYCKRKKAQVYAIDWQRSLSTLLYAAMGQKVPFADSIKWSCKKEFNKLAGEEIESLTAKFNEGRGNPLADIRHRGHLLKKLSEEGGWASGGMLADMGIHPIHAVTGAGFRLKKITEAFFAGPSNKRGYRKRIKRQRYGGNEPESYARVHAEMSFNEQSDIPVIFECGKGSAPNMNDMQTIIKFKSGKTLVHEFGHRVNRVILSDKDGKILASAKDRGEPYERMFLEASASFDKQKESGKKRAVVAHGEACSEAIKVIEEAHRFACDMAYDDRNPGKMKQIALEERWGKVKDAGEKAKDFKTVKIKRGQFKKITPKEVLGDSCQWHANAEGATFDQKPGFFYYVDNELGFLARYNPKTKEHKAWRLASDELDVDGRPKQMLSVARVNQDGAVMVLLSEGGKNAGLNYFNPETGELKNVGKIPGWEKRHKDHRPNDETIIKIGGRNCILYGTMDRHWDKKFDKKSKLKRNAGYYLIDPETLESRKLKFRGNAFNSTIITNGLADGGDAGDGKRYIFWAETVEDAGVTGEQINVYHGVLDPKTCEVFDINIFKNHQELGGSMNGTDTYGRPDGAKMGLYNGREAYGVSVLENGEIRFFYSNPKDKEFGKEALRIQLPKGMTRNTQFALGTDGNGKPIGLVTTQDSGYFTRRWQVGETRTKAKDGLNGSVIQFDLPEGLEAHPDSIERVNYPAFKDIKTPASISNFENLPTFGLAA